MSLFRIFAMSLLIPALWVSQGCSENPVGRKCSLGIQQNPNESVVASPALECASRTCLYVPQDPGTELPPMSEHTALCTAECSSDSDCDRSPESPCQTGFTCAVATTTGDFCCRKLCQCRDYLNVPEGGLPTPAPCEPDNPANTCINLPGRS